MSQCNSISYYGCFCTDFSIVGVLPHQHLLKKSSTETYMESHLEWTSSHCTVYCTDDAGGMVWCGFTIHLAAKHVEDNTKKEKHTHYKASLKRLQIQGLILSGLITHFRCIVMMKYQLYVCTVDDSLLCVMSVAMALVAASNTLGEEEWSNMAAINCLWTGVLETISKKYKYILSSHFNIFLQHPSWRV